MKISNTFFALMGAILLSANALAEEQKAPDLVAYDINGDDTDEQAYELKSADDLYWFAEYVNQGGDNANAFLANDIVVNEDLLASLEADNLREWFPIGYFYDLDKDGNFENISFAGTFDGQGYTISGLYFNNKEQYYVGLFGQINYSATIKNVSIVDSYFNGIYNIGGVCGCSYGTIENCYNTSNVNGSNNMIGGVCGANYSTIENCYNSGEVNGSKDVGGVCGYNSINCTIKNSYNTGEVSNGGTLGGLCGDNDGAIENCYDFKLNSGTLSGYSIVVEDNTIALPTEDMVSLKGYKFGGWYDNADCEGKVITSETKFDDVHTLYAKWEDNTTPTAIKAVETESDKTIKTIKDGQIVIIRNGVMYDMQGRKL